MDILLTAATMAEIGPLISVMDREWKREADQVYGKGDHRVTLLITGVGMVATSYRLTKAFQNARYDLAIQAGIAGSFDRSIPLGGVVQVTRDQFGDLGAEDHYNFLDVFELGLEDANGGVFQNKLLVNPSPLSGLREVSGLTINTVSGSSFTIEAREKKYQPQVESMEGAAFHYVCLQEGVRFAQIRAVSNYVEPRNRESWKIKEAVGNLNTWMAGWLTHQE